jgi:hypothetical protein
MPRGVFPAFLSHQERQRKKRGDIREKAERKRETRLGEMGKEMGEKGEKMGEVGRRSVEKGKDIRERWEAMNAHKKWRMAFKGGNFW